MFLIETGSLGTISQLVLNYITAMNYDLLLILVAGGIRERDIFIPAFDWTKIGEVQDDIISIFVQFFFFKDCKFKVCI